MQLWYKAAGRRPVHSLGLTAAEAKDGGVTQNSSSHLAFTVVFAAVDGDNNNDLTNIH